MNRRSSRNTSTTSSSRCGGASAAEKLQPSQQKPLLTVCSSAVPHCTATVLGSTASASGLRQKWPHRASADNDHFRIENACLTESQNVPCREGEAADAADFDAFYDVQILLKFHQLTMTLVSSIEKLLSTTEAPQSILGLYQWHIAPSNHLELPGFGSNQ